MKQWVVFRRFAGLAFALSISSWVVSQGLPEVNQSILDEGSKHNQAMLHISHLTKKIGPRLLGSENLQKACDWTMGKFKEWGLSNVHFEIYLDVPVGFNRGKSQTARMISPVRRDFQFTTLAWSPGTHGLTRGVAIPEPETVEEAQKLGDTLKGAWIIASGSPLAMRSRPDVPTDERRRAINAMGPAGWVFASDSDYVHTSGNFRNLTMDNLPKITQVIVRASDMKAILGELNYRRNVVLEFDIDNRFAQGPIHVGNVIADIPGTEHPDEYVIIGAHMDSWDGPGSEGACDNGTGTTAVLEAARILSKFKVKPKRTIRFILFTGEEEGLLGSGAYVQKHEKELDKISAVFIDDSGTNYISGLMCTEAMAPQIEQAVAPLLTDHSGFEFVVKTTKQMSRRGGGSDHASFIAKGVPGFFMRKTGKANYFEIWHTQNDNLEHVVPDSLKRSALVFAMLSYNLACSDKMLPR